MRTALVLAILLAIGCGRTPRPAAPAAVKTTRSYQSQLVALDGALLISFIPVMYLADRNLDGDTTRAIAWTYVGAYALGGPAIHLGNGNPRQSGLSVVRRVGYPAALGLIVAGAILQTAGDNGCGDECGGVLGASGALAVTVGVLGALVHDWSKAHVKIDAPAPFVTADGERTVVGIGGRF